MAFVNNKDCKVFYDSFNLSDKGTPLFFIHGYLANHSVFKAQINFFKKKRPVIVMDIRGHGLSDVPTSRDDFRLDKVVKDMLLILDALCIKKVILVGHSMGGMISLLFSVKNPDFVEKLVLINSHYKKPNHLAIGYFNIDIGFFHESILFKKVYSSLLDNQDLDDIKNLDNYHDIIKKSEFLYIFDVLKHNSLKTVFFFWDEVFKFDVKSFLSSFIVKTLIIHSLKDQFFSYEEVVEFNSLMNNSELIIHEGDHAIVVLESSFVNDQLSIFFDS